MQSLLDPSNTNRFAKDLRPHPFPIGDATHEFFSKKNMTLLLEFANSLTIDDNFNVVIGDFLPHMREVYLKLAGSKLPILHESHIDTNKTTDLAFFTAPDLNGATALRLNPKLSAVNDQMKEYIREIVIQERARLNRFLTSGAQAQNLRYGANRTILGSKRAPRPYGNLSKRAMDKEIAFQRKSIYTRFQNSE